MDADKTEMQDQEPPKQDAAKPRRLANYVLASGANMGAAVTVVPMGEPVNGRADLALSESPEKKYQSLAPYSEGKEPGTWHWL